MNIPNVDQPNTWTCGAAATMSVCKFFAVGPDNLQDYVEALGTSIEKSTHPNNIISFLTGLGLNVQGRQNMTIADLKVCATDLTPVIMPVQDYGTEVPKEAAWAYGHYLSLCDVTDDFIICQDSSEENVLVKGNQSVQEPGKVAIAHDKWNTIWHDQDGDGNVFIHYGIVVETQQAPIHNLMDQVVKSETPLVECASAPIVTTEDAARELDEITKTLPAECRDLLITKAYDAYYQFEPNERAEISIISTSRKDIQSQVVKASGIDFDYYRKHGSVLWDHGKHSEQRAPVASCKWIRYNKEDDTIRAKTIYPERPKGHEGRWFTDDLWALTSCDPPLLKCKSIGFRPKKPLRGPTKEELDQHPEWEGASLYEEGICVEYSICPVGVNSDAVIDRINKSADYQDICKNVGLDIPSISDLEWCIQKSASNDCVSNKIKYLYDSGEAAKKGWSKKQIVAVAYAHCRGGKKSKKSFDIDAAIIKAIENIDVKKILRGG